MREIKFRAWSDGLGMTEPFTLRECINSDIDEYDIYLRYVGLNDKNKREIFENDIVKVKYLDDFEIMGVITFSHEGRFVIEGKDKDSFWCEYCLYKDMDIEVIGNIHENAELLEGNA